MDRADKTDQEVYEELLKAEQQPKKRDDVEYRCSKCGEKTHDINPEWLKWRRERAGYTMRGAANLWQKTPAYLSLLESGQTRCTLPMLTLYEELPK